MDNEVNVMGKEQRFDDGDIFNWIKKNHPNLIGKNPEKNDDLFNNNSFFLNGLNCSFLNKRKSNLDKPMCTLIQYTPLSNRNLSNSNYQNNI